MRLLEDLAKIAFMVWLLLMVPPHLQQQLSPDLPAAKADTGTSPAPIWSKRCEARGETMVAHQADGGPWVVRCVPSPKEARS